jgi:hypothetical protein
MNHKQDGRQGRNASLLAKEEMLCFTPMAKAREKYAVRRRAACASTTHGNGGRQRKKESDGLRGGDGSDEVGRRRQGIN